MLIVFCIVCVVVQSTGDKRLNDDVHWSIDTVWIYQSTCVCVWGGNCRVSFPLGPTHPLSRPFLRFGRDDNRNFLRFGRSVDRQLKEQKAHEAAIAPTAVPAAAKTQDSHRSKRSASPYNYVVMPSHGPAAWAQDFQPDQEDEDLDVAIDGPEGPVTKRGYNRSFLRFGRDRNFLRFGKRNDDSASDVMVVEPASYPRYQRAPQRNFLRFG